MTADPFHRRHTVDLSYFDANTVSPTFQEDITSIAECYQRVYGSDMAWNEGTTCPACSVPGAPRKWNYCEEVHICPDCGGPTQHFWPIPVIIRDMIQELALPDAVCAVARCDGQVVGAAWGFSASAQEMEDHLNHDLPPEAQVRGVREALETRFPGRRVAHQDEIFVHPSMQGLGIGRALFGHRHRRFVEAGLSGCVLRTKTDPPARTYLWFGSARWGYQIIGRYPDTDGRVVMAVSFERLNRCIQL